MGPRVPRVVTAGYCPVDLVPLPGNVGHSLTAGGTCGNVSVVLHHLGNHVTPVIPVGSDPRGERLRAVLLAHGLDTSAIVTLAGRETPAVTQELVSGAPGRHRFSFSCPSCHKLFPRSPGITLAMAASVADRLDEAQAFFFDRAAPGSLQLAAAAGASELLVMFEPNNIRPSSMYAAAAELSDVVKYSSDADAETQSWAPSSSARTKLIVQTLGSDGAMYRLRQPNGSWRDWSRLPGFCAQVVEDTAGAGDWCSAGLLHHLLRSPSAERFAETNIERAIQFGQALAAASVSFRGPQGALSQMEMRFLSRMARAAMHSGRVRVPEFPGKLARAMSLSTVPQAVCATCLSPQQSDDC